MKKLMALSLLTVVLVVVCILIFGQGKNSYHGIYITFEDDTPAEHIEDIIERYNPDESFNDFPRYVRLTYFHKSEREVKELINQIMDEEDVLVASYVLVSASALDYPK